MVTGQVEQLFKEGARVVAPEDFLDFILSFLMEGVSDADILDILDRYSYLLEWTHPLHCLALLGGGISLAGRMSDAARETGFRQRAGLVEGYARAGSQPPLSFGPQSLIDERVRVYFGLRGGMGEVFFGRDEREDRPCAVKMPLTDGYDHFLEEASAWLLLSGHPNIVEAFFSGSHGSRQYLLMEYVPGELGVGPSLRARMQTRPPDVKEVLDYSLQFCDGMCWARSKVPDIVHRDLKPDNILIDHEGTLKISDWGLVAGSLPSFTDFRLSAGADIIYHGPANVPVIPEGARCGTPQYMSPEQFRGAKAAVRSDVYAFGCVLYEMLKRRPPFLRADLDGYAEAHARARHEQLGAPFESAAPGLSAVVDRCLAKDPAERFSDFAEVRAELLRIYERATGVAWARARQPTEPPLEIQIERVIGLSKTGKQEAALRDIDRILVGHPEDTFALFTKANVLKELTRYDEAIEVLLKALAADDEQPSIWFNLAVLYLLKEEGKTERARPCLERASQLNHPRAKELLDSLDSGNESFIIIT